MVWQRQPWLTGYDHDWQDCSESRGPKLGCSTELSEEEEAIIMESLLLLMKWGFPFSKKDLTLLVKDDLDRQVKKTRFVNNRPGPDCMEGFLRRHPQLSVWKANLIKRSRAAVSHYYVNKFFDNYEAAVARIPPENMFSFNETCLGDSVAIQIRIRKDPSFICWIQIQNFCSWFGFGFGSSSGCSNLISRYCTC